MKSVRRNDCSRASIIYLVDRLSATLSDPAKHPNSGVRNVNISLSCPGHKITHEARGISSSMISVRSVLAMKSES